MQSRPVLNLVAAFYPFLVCLPVPPDTSGTLSDVATNSPPVATAESNTYSATAMFRRETTYGPSGFESGTAPTAALILEGSQHFVLFC